MWGWFVVYILMVIANAGVNKAAGWSFGDYEYWISIATVILSYISGREFERIKQGG